MTTPWMKADDHRTAAESILQRYEADGGTPDDLARAQVHATLATIPDRFRLTSDVTADFVTAEVERAEREYAAGHHLVDRVDDQVHVEPEVGSVVELQDERDAGSDREGLHVPIACTGEEPVELERRAPQASDEHIEVEEDVVVHLDGDSAGSVHESSHGSPSVGGPGVAPPCDRSEPTVGDAPGVTPSAHQGHPEGGAE